MTTRQIEKAIGSGQVVVLKDDPLSRIIKDIFGNLVVESLHREPEPTRLVTLSDKRRARIQDKRH